jgi:hypothetical protein
MPERREEKRREGKGREGKGREELMFVMSILAQVIYSW